MDIITIGDRVSTIQGLHGILVDVKKGYFGETAFIKTDDGKIYYCPISNVCNYLYIRY